MRFIDEAIIRVSGGHGGRGAVSFRREKFIPRGGPDGGDGGKGGDIIFIASSQLGTLQDFRFKRLYQAKNGDGGAGTNKAGRDGEDIQIRIPVGTVVRNVQTGEVLIDFAENGQTWVACKGGRGGKGNAHFVSSTFQAPKFSQPGEEGETLELQLELKLLADAGIIGFPNAGKSTLISRISAAKPKIADYPFTTLTPNLGVVSLADFQNFVVADIPGLIEGASKGMGLGHRFLKHIERTSVFVHLLDGASFLEAATRPGDAGGLQEAIHELVQKYLAIRKELEIFNPELINKPEIVAINKMDLLESDPTLIHMARSVLKEKIDAVRSIPTQMKEPFLISAVSGVGIKELMSAVWDEILVNRARPPVEIE